MLLLLLGAWQTRGVDSEARGRLTIRDFGNEIRNEEPGCRVGKFVSSQVEVYFDPHNSCVLKTNIISACAAMCNLRIDHLRT